MQPPPRMYSRLVTDTKNQVLVLFGGDGQSHYLADTWLFDLKTPAMAAVEGRGGPAAALRSFRGLRPRAGPGSSIGGGFHRDDLDDMWASMPPRKSGGGWPGRCRPAPTSAPTWRRRSGIAAGVATAVPPIMAAAATCSMPVRTTYGYRIDQETLFRPDKPAPQQRPAETAGRPERPRPAGRPRAAEDAGRATEEPAGQSMGGAGRPGPRARRRAPGAAPPSTATAAASSTGAAGTAATTAATWTPTTSPAHTWISSAEAPEYPHRL